MFSYHIETSRTLPETQLETLNRALKVSHTGDDMWFYKKKTLNLLKHQNGSLTTEQPAWLLMATMQSWTSHLESLIKASSATEAKNAKSSNSVCHGWTDLIILSLSLSSNTNNSSMTNHQQKDLWQSEVDMEILSGTSSLTLNAVWWDKMETLTPVSVSGSLVLHKSFLLTSK